MKQTDIQIVKKIAHQAWLESRTFEQSFETFWSVHQQKLEQQHKFFKAGIKNIINSNYGSELQTIEAGADRYVKSKSLRKKFGHLLYTLTRIRQTFIDGAHSDEAKKFWFNQFLTEQYLKDKENVDS